MSLFPVNRKNFYDLLIKRKMTKDVTMQKLEFLVGEHRKFKVIRMK